MKSWNLCQTFFLQIYTARRNMLACQTQFRVLQPQYAILKHDEYQKKNTPREGESISAKIFIDIGC